MSTGTRCRCCGSADVALKGRKPGKFIRREFEFWQCAGCGFIFVEPFSGFAIYDEAYYRGEGPDPYVDYETEYRDWRRTDRMLELDDLVRIAEQHVAASAVHIGGARSKEQGAGYGPKIVATGCGSAVVIEGLAPAPCPLLPAPPAVAPAPAAAAPRPLSWLDFGCGAGALLKYLRERRSLAGCPLELTGHDVGSYAEMLASRDGFRILGWQELSADDDARYDIISMIEVLEHLPDPRVALSLVARLLKPGGLLLLTTGNLGSPIATRRGIHYRYCAPEIHVSLFNPRCLSELYRQLGLEALRVRYEGVVKFKVVKSLRRRPALRRLAQALLGLPGTVRAIDAAYGVSDMPCATKPAQGPKPYLG